jgi:bacterioferritin (cytochrome b1)
LVVSSLPGRTSRRKLLRASGAAIVLAGCGPANYSPPRFSKLPPVARRSDVELLNGTLDLEHQLIAAYTAAVPLLSGGRQSAARRFLNQHLAHAGQLIALVRQAGGRPMSPKPSYELGNPRTPEDLLVLLHSLERGAIAAYLESIPELAPPQVRAAVAAILANEAQHVAILRARLGKSAVPSALVTGSE